MSTEPPNQQRIFLARNDDLDSEISLDYGNEAACSEIMMSKLPIEKTKLESSLSYE